jgi:GxxExxY protein
MELNDISGAIVNSAMLVHSELGPGLLEEPYKRCLRMNLKDEDLMLL